ncbi:MAG: hypothetical protein ABJN26_28550 [Stappiaceae bacterium]
MNWTIDFAPLVPLPLLIVLAVVAAGLSGLSLYRKQRGAVIRLGAFAAFILALMNPAIEKEDREPLTSVVALVVDDSQSQDLDGRKAMTDEAREKVIERLDGLPGFEVRVIEAGRDSEFERRDGTELFGALENGLADVPPDRVAGAIFITDGQVHDAPQKPESLDFRAPIHGLITGREDEIDRRLVLDRAPKFGLVGTEQIVNLRLVDQLGSNALPSRDARIRVRRDGEPIGTIRVSPDEPIAIPVEIEHGGDNIFEFEAEALEGELTSLNNRLVVTIDGIRENLRVLLVSGEPHAGERTWRNLLKSDASVDLVHFTILRPPEKQDGTPINQLSLIAFPTRELFSVKIDEFDLIIFDRYQRRGVLPILYFDNIARYVRNGGAILLASGPEFSEGGSLYRTPLATVLPAEPSGNVTEQPYKALVTELGTRHPVSRSLPGANGDDPTWSEWFRLVDAEHKSGDTIMNGPDDRPLVILDRQGEGRVAMMLSDHAWLWARGFDGGGPHVPLLRNMAHWLMKEPDLEEEALRVRARGRELVVERQTLGESVDAVTVTNPTGQEQELVLEEADPGLWRATIPTADLGLYSVTDGERTALANVGPPNPKEFSDVRSTVEKLTPIATATAGSVQRLAKSGDQVSVPRIVPIQRATTFAGNGWIGLKTTDASILKGVDRYPLLAGFLGLAILLGALTLTWFREGR